MNELTKETEASRYNEGKARFSFIDFNMFEDMHKYFNYTYSATTMEDCVKGIIRMLSIITKDDDAAVPPTFIPLLQAYSYRASLIYLNLPFHDSPIFDFRAFEPMAEVMEMGAKKYSPNNWRKGYVDKFSAADSLYRHLREVIIGNPTDEESGLSHMGHIMCNVMFLTNDLLYIKR
jgi:hypothetical protein